MIHPLVLALLIAWGVILIAALFLAAYTWVREAYFPYREGDEAEPPPPVSLEDWRRRCDGSRRRSHARRPA